MIMKEGRKTDGILTPVLSAGVDMAPLCLFVGVCVCVCVLVSASFVVTALLSSCYRQALTVACGCRYRAVKLLSNYDRSCFLLQGHTAIVQLLKATT